MSEENDLSNEDNAKLKSRMTAKLDDLYLFCFLLLFWLVRLVLTFLIQLFVEI